MNANRIIRPVRALALLAISIHIGACGDRITPPDDEDDPLPVPGEFGEAAPTPVTLAAPPVLAGRGHGPGGNNPADFPTVMDIDFGAFPAFPTHSCTGSWAYYVSTTGSDGGRGTSAAPFRTIVRALEVARAGEVVIVRAGRYQEGATDEYRSLVITQPRLSLCAAPGDSVVVTPRGAIAYGLSINADSVRVSGINLLGYSTTLLQLGEGGTLTHVILQNMTLTATGTGGKDGIGSYGTRMNGLLIWNVTVDSAHIGISCGIGPCRNWRLHDVTVRNDPRDGDTGYDAIAIENGDNFLLSNVEATGAPGDGLDFKGTNVAAFNVNVHDNMRNGVKFWRGGDLVNSYVIANGADAGVVFEHGASYRILGCVVAYTNYPEIRSYSLGAGFDDATEPSTLSIINTVFHRNTGPIWVSGATSLTLTSTLLGATPTGDVAFKTDGIFVSNDEPASALSRIATISGMLPFSTDPRFVNPDGRDFVLATGSPLINAGTVVARFPSYDYAGRPRVAGGLPDIGPVERQ